MTSPSSKPSAATDAPASNGSSSTSTAALPADHLSHPENWATGADPATHKQQAFVASLERQHGVELVVDEGQLGKSEASELIDKLKQGDVDGARKVVGAGEKRGIEKVDGDAAGEGKGAGAAKEDDAPGPDAAAAADKEGDDAAPPSKKPKKDDPKAAAASVDGTPTKKAESSAAAPEEGTPAESSADATADATTTADGTTIDSGKDTSTGAPAVTEANGESRLDHPENWATGDDPATDKQLAYLAVLEKQKNVEPSSEEQAGELGKTAASEKIDRLKNDA